MSASGEPSGIEKDYTPTASHHFYRWVVEHPVAVDPDPQLQQHAHRHGWPIISLRV